MRTPMTIFTRRKTDDAIRRSGFTLLELIAVMVILAVALGIAAPSLRGFAQSQRTANIARRMLALMDYAQSSAINQGRVYRFHYDQDDRVFWISVQQGAEFVELENEFGQTFDVPEQIDVVWRDENGSQTDIDFVVFYPTGRTQPSSLRVSGPDGKMVEVHCAAPTQAYRILSREETAQRR